MRVQQMMEMVLEEARKVIVGQEEAIRLLTVALLCGGNVLLEGVPGTAKTLMARTLALLVQGEFKRVQFTPDLMPSDIVGTSVFDVETSRFHLKKGPVFTNVLLADEINRSPAKTQSALLEAMEERQVTIDGTRYPLPALFMVVATQNPIEHEGTYPLPEAQLDRFLFKVNVGFGTQEQENEILMRYHSGFDSRRLEQVGLQPIVDEAGLIACQDEIRRVAVEPGVANYITTIARESRRNQDLLLGGSVRASVGLLLASKAWAASVGRDYVIPDDVKALTTPIYRHRVILTPEAEIEGMGADALIGQLLAKIEVPR